MERNGCRHRRSHHWRFTPLTLVITWTSAQFFCIIPWIDDGRHVTDIYEYVDTDFMVKFCACKQHLYCQAALAMCDELFKVSMTYGTDVVLSAAATSLDSCLEVYSDGSDRHFTSLEETEN